MTDIRFETPYALVLLGVVVIFFLLMIVRGIIKMRSLRRIGDNDLIERMMSQVSYTRRKFKAFFWLLMLAMLAIAAARPTWGVTTDFVQISDFDLYVLFDVSLSMDAQDVVPSRLERGVLDLQYILENVEKTPFSIILFANQSVSYMPMTSSLETADVFIRGIETDALTVQGSNAARAIELAVTSYQQSDAGSGAIILISDGEFFTGDLSGAIDLAQSARLPIYTIGYGTPEGATIPLYNAAGEIDQYKIDPSSGQLVVTRLDAEAMQRIALATGGGFIPVVDNTSDVNPIIEAINEGYENSFVQSFENRRSEQFPIFIAIALFALALDILLPETRREVQ